MSFFSRFSSPSKKGRNNFDKARAAEKRRDFDKAQSYFEVAASAYDEYFADLASSGKSSEPSHLAMAGICYTRLGRNDDAIKVLDQCISQKDIPDAFLHAGFAAAKLGKQEDALSYWSQYPDWYEQPLIKTELKQQIRALKTGEHDLQTACEAIVQAVYSQDKRNKAHELSTSNNNPYPPNRGY